MGHIAETHTKKVWVMTGVRSTVTVRTVVVEILSTTTVVEKAVPARGAMPAKYTWMSFCVYLCVYGDCIFDPRDFKKRKKKNEPWVNSAANMSATVNHD